MGIEDEKKPYQPTDEEIKKAEEMMDESQKDWTKYRESGIKENEVYDGMGIIKIKDSGEIRLVELSSGYGSRGEIISALEALSRLNAGEKEARAWLDQIDYFKKKISEIKK